MVTQKEAREKEKTRKEKLGGYFYNLSQLSFAGMVVGGIAPLFNNNTTWDYLTISLGILSTVIFAIIANKILK